MKREMLRFLMVGLTSTLVNYVVYLLGCNIGMSLFMASVVGYLAGLCNSYYFGKNWVFDMKTSLKYSTILRFAIIYLVGGLGMAVIIEILDMLLGWNYRITWFVGAAYAFVNNFCGSKWLVFRKGIN